jgi:uncharacterized repeat protein (TIGR01451 family)
MTNARTGWAITCVAICSPALLATSNHTTYHVSSGGSYPTIQGAINAASSGDLIVIDDAVHTESGITINKNLTIMGSGAAATIVQAHATEGSANARVFTISAGVTATISNMAIRHGQAPNASVAGAAGSNGGAILNQGTLTISGCTLTLNRAGRGADGINSGGQGGCGGAISNTGVLTIASSSITGNRAGNGGNGTGMMMASGGSAGCGGGVHSTGTLSMTSVIVDGNGAGIAGTGSVGSGMGGMGGGLFDAGAGTTAISTCSFSDNTVTTAYYGGGIYTESSMTISRSTIADNQSEWGGGGIFFLANNNARSLTLTNSTVANNSTGRNGGGIIAYAQSGVATLSLTNCTINGNAATEAGNGHGGGLCGFSNGSTPIVNLKSSIIANNTSTTAMTDLGSYSTGSPTVVFNSQDYNLIEDTAGGTIEGTTTHNITGQDPLLSSLASNGGSTKTMALQNGSPALDQIPAGTNGMGASPLNVDQRGSTRPCSTLGDLGAFELGAPLVTTTSASNIAPTSVSTGGNVTNQGATAVTARGVCWNTTGTPTTSNSKTTDGTGTGAFTSSLTDLTANTTYYVRAYATNSIGTGYGDQVTFTTPADTDGDGTADGSDGCPNDASKIAAGACGCGMAETDSDADGTPDCTDQCDDDANKIVPGTCGCGVADTDSDGDGTPDCNDQCPNAADKVAPGVCGCDAADADTDGDDTLNCEDSCPNDAGKTEPGTCGCGIADTDTDSDGTLDCTDQCPADPDKIQPGTAGCGIPEPIGAADVRVTVQKDDDESENETHVGDQIPFLVTVQNVGTSGAGHVVIRVPIPGGTLLISAEILSGPAAASLPGNMTIEGDELVVDCGDLPAGENVQVRLVLEATNSGQVAVNPTTSYDGAEQAVQPETPAEVPVGDTYAQIITTTTPVCGSAGLVPLLMTGIVLAFPIARRYSSRH